MASDPRLFVVVLVLLVAAAWGARGGPDWGRRDDRTDGVGRVNVAAARLGLLADDQVLFTAPIAI